MDITGTLLRAVELWPDREAVVDGELRLSYGQLWQRAAALARGLAELGLAPGRVAATLAPNVHEHLEAYYAAALGRAALAPVNVRLDAAEVARVLDRSEARVLLVHGSFASLAREAIAALGRPLPTVLVGEGELEDAVPYEALAASDPEPMELQSARPDELAHLYFTSGTTGSPKGVMLTHGNVTAHALAAIAELGLSDRDSWLHAAPLFHLADAWATFAVTWVGGRHVCLPTFEAEAALAAIERERVTLTNLIPTMLSRMLAAHSIGRRDISSLRLILSGGAPIAPETVRRIVAAFGCEYVQTYGMTETSPYLTLSLPKAHQLALPPEEVLRVRSRTGRPVIGVELRVVREDGTDVARDDREVGEIWVRGPTVTPGYFRDAEATAAAFTDGWLMTGDLAVIDREGSVDIVDRKKDVIVTGGEKVHSTEVEKVLHEHPSVLECAVVGVPDAVWGEAVKAVVVARPDAHADEAALLAFARSRLAHFKAPRSVDFVQDLPRTGSGKIAKRLIRDGYWSGRHRRV